MTTAEGRRQTDPTVDRDRHQPGSAASRIAEAGKQLAIALEEVDLEAEPAFGDALVAAVDAADEAASRARRHPGDGSSAEMVFGGER